MRLTYEVCGTAEVKSAMKERQEDEAYRDKELDRDLQDDYAKSSGKPSKACVCTSMVFWAFSY